MYSIFPQGKGTFEISDDFDQNTRGLKIIRVLDAVSIHTTLGFSIVGSRFITTYRTFADS